jgi:hypothetical protein
METINQTTTATEPQQESILEDVIDTSAYEKTLRTGRIWLYVVAGLQLLMGIYEYSITDEKYVAIIAFGIQAFIAVMFLALALWSKKKPVPAFTTALIAYLFFAIGFMFLDPSNIYRGILVKIFLVIALVKANRDARRYQEAKSL